MNIAVVIYSVIWAAEEDYVWFWRECSLNLPKCVYVHEITRDQASSTEFFLNESLQNTFPNNVLISKFHDECG